MAKEDTEYQWPFCGAQISLLHRHFTLYSSLFHPFSSLFSYDQTLFSSSPKIYSGKPELTLASHLLSAYSLYATGSDTPFLTNGITVGTESYYYTYIDTGDGEETRCLKMKDDYTGEVIDDDDDDDDDVTDEDTTENKNKENSPDTGDHTDFLIWLFVCFLSLGGIGVAFRLRKAHYNSRVF